MENLGSGIINNVAKCLRLVQEDTRLPLDLYPNSPNEKHSYFKIIVGGCLITQSAVQLLLLGKDLPIVTATYRKRIPEMKKLKRGKFQVRI